MAIQGASYLLGQRFCACFEIWVLSQNVGPIRFLNLSKICQKSVRKLSFTKICQETVRNVSENGQKSVSSKIVLENYQNKINYVSYNCQNYEMCHLGQQKSVRILSSFPLLTDF